MTDTNKEALEALNKLKGWALFEIEEFADIRPVEKAYQTIRAALMSSDTAINLTQADLCKVGLKENALQPKPSVDVEGLKKKTRCMPERYDDDGYLENGSEHAVEVIYNDGWNDCVDALYSQGYLNQGWQPIDITKPENYNKLGIFALKQKGGNWYYEKAYCDYIEDGWPLIDPEYGDILDAYNFTDYEYYMPLQPPSEDK